MPLPVLPASNTARWKLGYTVGETDHVFQVRSTGAASPSSFAAWVDSFLTALSPALYAMTLTSVQFASPGSDIFNLVATSIIGNPYGSGVIAGFRTPQFVAFQGRSSGGRKVRLSVYGFKFDTNDYRVNPGELDAVDDAILVLAGSTTFGVAIDGIDPTWYPYANTGFNAYWQRQLRG